MNRRRTRRRETAYEAEKNSFSASAPTNPPPHNSYPVKEAINESLCAVRFNAHDMRTVLSAARGSKKRRPAKKKRRGFKPDLIFAFSLMLMVALPLSLYAMRSRTDITTVSAAPGEATAQPAVTTLSGEDAISASPTAAPTSLPADALTYGVGESEAIRIARACFEANCDTTIFTFEEYEVSVALSESTSPQYTVTLESIYKNGCYFTVSLSADNGEILQYSTPKLATVPAHLDTESPEVRAWYDKYGAYLFTWPQDVQAEFSRRYEGGTLRSAKEGEISYDDALAAVRDTVTSEAPGLFSAFYPVLYSERAGSDSRAYYVVYCYAKEITDSLPDGEPMIVTFDAASGDILSIEGSPLNDDALSINVAECGK